MLKCHKQKRKKREVELFLGCFKAQFPAPTLLLGAGRKKKGIARHDLGVFILVITAGRGLWSQGD